METVFTLVNQTILMFALAAVGYLLFRGGKLTLEGSRSMGNMLLYLVLPCVIVNGFLVERTRENLLGLALSAGLALVILLASILVSRLCFPKDPIAAFAGAFPNPGFFGVPLIVASLSSGAVFYVAAFIGFLNLFQWSYGVGIMTGKKGRITAGSLVRAPFFWAIVVGLVLFLTQIPVPAQARTLLGYITALNTPLSMIVVGVYLAQTDLLAMLRNRKVYLVSAVRLLLLPLLAVLLLIAVPDGYSELKMAMLIVAGCPVGSNIAVYAQLHHQDYAYAVQTVVVSTVLSIVTIPMIVLLGMMV